MITVTENSYDDNKNDFLYELACCDYPTLNFYDFKEMGKERGFDLDEEDFETYFDFVRDVTGTEYRRIWDSYYNDKVDFPTLPY